MSVCMCRVMKCVCAQVSGCKTDLHVQRSGCEMCPCAGVGGVRYMCMCRG